jgi:two-component system, chemotaxis family, protein-glutamate methylesterase/glutaminase
VVVGGSAGSLAPLRQLAAALPPGLPGAIAVTIHVGEQAQSRLPAILDRWGPLAAAHARTGELLRSGRIYVAPPGRHLLMPAGVVELSPGPRMNRTRPAVDAMFASAARWFGDQVVAVVLSGMLDDGAVGAALVEQTGGLVVVQDPQEAARPSMPQAALAAARTAIPVPSAELGRVVSGMLGDSGLVSRPRTEPHEPAEMSMEEGSDLQFLAPGETSLTRLAGPECGGALAEAALPNITYYRCRVGHQFSPESLAVAQTETAEAKLWAAVAALEETAVLEESRRFGGDRLGKRLDLGQPGSHVIVKPVGQLKCVDVVGRVDEDGRGTSLTQPVGHGIEPVLPSRDGTRRVVPADVADDGMGSEGP